MCNATFKANLAYVKYFDLNTRIALLINPGINPGVFYTPKM